MLNISAVVWNFPFLKTLACSVGLIAFMAIVQPEFNSGLTGVQFVFFYCGPILVLKVKYFIILCVTVKIQTIIA